MMKRAMYEEQFPDLHCVHHCCWDKNSSHDGSTGSDDPFVPKDDERDRIHCGTSHHVTTPLDLHNRWRN
jgi:hypothetical protein